MVDSLTTARPTPPRSAFLAPDLGTTARPASHEYAEVSSAAAWLRFRRTAHNTDWRQCAARRSSLRRTALLFIRQGSRTSARVARLAGWKRARPRDVARLTVSAVRSPRAGEYADAANRILPRAESVSGARGLCAAVLAALAARSSPLAGLWAWSAEPVRRWPALAAVRDLSRRCGTRHDRSGPSRIPTVSSRTHVLGATGSFDDSRRIRTTRVYTGAPSTRSSFIGSQSRPTPRVDPEAGKPRAPSALHHRPHRWAPSRCTRPRGAM